VTQPDPATSPTASRTDTSADKPQVSSGVLTRYRVMAWVTGVLLLVLVFVAMPMKYIGDDERLVQVVGVAHGWLYMLYLVAAFLLANKLRWPLGKTLLLLVAGTIPFMSFVAERRVLREMSAGPTTPPPATRA
jgi:integral membrane protein